VNEDQNEISFIVIQNLARTIKYSPLNHRSIDPTRSMPQTVQLMTEVSTKSGARRKTTTPRRKAPNSSGCGALQWRIIKTFRSRSPFSQLLLYTHIVPPILPPRLVSRNLFWHNASPLCHLGSLDPHEPGLRASNARNSSRSTRRR
jgi:hypothetical protein